MNVLRDKFKAFKLHRIIFEFTEDELQRVVFTDEEQAILHKRCTTPEEKLERAYTIAKAVCRVEPIIQEKKKYRGIR